MGEAHFSPSRRSLGRMSYCAYPEGREESPVRREEEGASAGGLTWGGASRSRELRPTRHALPCSLPRSLSLRLARRPLVEAGPCRCARCGKLIEPGMPLDLGHVDGSGKTFYSGPE